jgi:hypothetical protein
MPEMVSAAVPVSVTVMDWAVLVDPTNWPEKVSDVEESEIAGEVAGGVVLLEPPPQQVKRANPTRAARLRVRVPA